MLEEGEPRDQKPRPFRYLPEKVELTGAGWCIGGSGVLGALAMHSPISAAFCIFILALSGMIVAAMKTFERMAAERNRAEAQLVEIAARDEALKRDHQHRMQEIQMKEQANAREHEIRKIEAVGVAVCNEVMARGKAFTIGNGLIPPDDLTGVKVFQ